MGELCAWEEKKEDVRGWVCVCMQGGGENVFLNEFSRVKFDPDNDKCFFTWRHEHT